MDPSLFRYIWRNSRREQIAILMLILFSLPFYWLSLDVPKRIVNEALQGEAFRDGNTTATLFRFSFDLPDWLGGYNVNLFDGVAYDQIGYLLALSFLFLAFVLINGAFKYRINIDKGVLAERLLRRLRFDLFALMMRFRPEDIRQVKPAEAASMINNEVEPIGAFSGDAFVWPVFLASQALTALIFILVQSMWLGLVALSIVLVQAFVIPILRRKQLELARQRQLAARRLSGRIGEMVDGAPLIHTHGTVPYSEAEIGSRLSRLFDIRVALYKRKYAVKYLNTLLSQVTPFFFYAIGGYFALTGSLDIGQLVAVIAAYKDLPGPIKELIDWDQRRADITIKYQQVTTQFAAEPLLPSSQSDDVIEELLRPEPIRVEAVSVSDQRGTAILENSTAVIERPSHVAAVGTTASARDVFVRVLGRQQTDVEGRVFVGNVDLGTVSDYEASRVMAFLPADPIMVPGTIEDNILGLLKRYRPSADELGATSPIENLNAWISESERVGNPTIPYEADWIDYAAAGVSDHNELCREVIRLIETVGMGRDLYGFGLLGTLPADTPEDQLARVVTARDHVRRRLEEEEMLRTVEPFDPDKFNSNSALGENLVFGLAAGSRLTQSGLAHDPYFQSIITAEALDKPLVVIGAKIIETALETLSELPAGHPLFERYEMIQQSEMEAYGELNEKFQSRDADQRLTHEDQSALIGLALQYSERRHRLGLIDDVLEQRILRARKSFTKFLPQDYAEEIEFFDPARVTIAAPIRDNLLFGRVAYGVANAFEKVDELLRETLCELDLMDAVYRQGLTYNVGPGGSNLVAPQRMAISAVRAVLSRPHILVTEGGFSSFAGDELAPFVRGIKALMEGRTVVMALGDDGLAGEFDQTIKFEGVRLVSSTQNSQAASRVRDTASSHAAE